MPVQTRRFIKQNSQAATGYVKRLKSKMIMQIHDEPARAGNPYTGNDLILDARRVVTFKCSKEKINVKMKK